MKKLLKILGIASIFAAVLGFGFVACDNDGGGGDSPTFKAETKVFGDAEMALVAAIGVDVDNITDVAINGEAIVTLADDKSSITSVKSGTTKIEVTDGTKTAVVPVTVKSDGTIVFGTPYDKDSQTPPPQQDESILVTWSDTTKVSAGSSIASNLGSGVTMTAVQDITPAAGEKTCVFKGENRTTTHTFVLGGALLNGNGDKTNRGINVKLTKAATIVVYGTTGTAGQAAYLGIVEMNDVSKKTIKSGTLETQQVCFDGSDTNCAVFNVKANTDYCIGSQIPSGKTGANAVVTLIYIVYGDLDETSMSNVEAKAATCTEDGNEAYSLTNYGRAMKNGTAVAKSDVAIPATGHKYTYTASSITLPTATDTGSVQFTCANDSTHTDSMELPALTSDKYTQTASSTAGKSVYTIAKSGAWFDGTKTDTVAFEADTVTPKEYEYVSVYSNDFSTDADVSNGKDNATADANGVLIYGDTNGTWGDTQKVAIADGALKVIDTGDKTTFGYLVYETPKTAGQWKVTGTIKIGATGGKWSALQIVSEGAGNSTTPGDEFLAAFRQNSGGTMVAGDKDNAQCGTGTFAVAADTSYKFEAVVDLDSRTVTLSMGVSNATTLTTLGSVEIAAGSTFGGLKMQTADSATNRSVTIDDVVIYEYQEKN